MTENAKVRQLFADALSGRIDRREVIKRAAAIGLSAPVAVALAQASVGAGFSNVAMAQDGGATGTFYSWMTDLHPAIFDVGKENNIKVEVAPTTNFGFDRFVSEAKDQKSTWDFYGGVTPFLEMIALVESGTIEPWDPYLPADVLGDILPAPKAEGMHKGSMDDAEKFYVWPFLLDITINGWNAAIVEKAGLDPETGPKDWTEFLANAEKVKSSGAAPYGCVFDFHDWRSLIPITHSISTDVYTPDGLFKYNSDAAQQALELMKQMMQYAPADILNEGSTDGGVNATPDEQAFAAEQAAYYIKYQNAHLRMAAQWADPSKVRLAAMPIQEGGAGGTVFWDTGIVLFKYGKNKEASASFVEKLSKDTRIWQNSVTGNPDEGTVPVGQMPILQSIWDDWKNAAPDYIKNNQWVFGIYDGLSRARAIAPSILAVSQFTVARPEWLKYLTGEEADAKVALQKAMDAVVAEYKKQTGKDPQM